MTERNYSRAERRALEAAYAAGPPVECPSCGALLTITPVPTPPAVSYVRRRVLLVCPRCHRSAAVDVRSDARP